MKKIKLLLITMIAFILLILIGNYTYASTVNLKMVEERPESSQKYTVITPGGTEHTVFKILKADGTANEAFYCARASLGFGNSEYVNSANALNSLTYTESFNLKEQATSVMTKYRTEIGYSSITDKDYNSMLWIIDNMYLPNHKDHDYMKAKLLERADLGGSYTYLTDDDIEFVQQMALWYFTEYDKHGQNGSLSLESDSLANATKINGAALNTSEQKAREIETLYKYFINSAKAHADEYGESLERKVEPVKPKIEVNSSSKKIDTSSQPGFTIVGPFCLTKIEGNVGYSLNIQVKDNKEKVITEKIGEAQVISVVNSPSEMTEVHDTIESKIDKGSFYLKIANSLATGYDLSDVNIEVLYNYDKVYKTTATLWVADEEDQPVIKVDKEEIIEGDFDLKLKKVDGDEILLPGAVFTMSTNDKRENIPLTSDERGIFRAPTQKITGNGQTFVYEIDETTVPTGYVGLKGTLKIQVTTKLNETETAYVVSKVEIIGASVGSVHLYWSSSGSNSTVTITIENKKIEGNLDFNIEKVSTEKTPLTGAEFKVTKDGTEITVTDNEDGTFKIPTEKITSAKDFIYEIEETTAPHGYVGLRRKLKVKITTKLDEDLAAYIVDKMEVLDYAGTSIEGKLEVNNSNSTVTLKITNNKIEGNFNLEVKKVDESSMPLTRAGFTVTKGEESIYLRDDNNGTFTSANQKITTEGEEFIYEIQETKVPNGYLGLSEKIKVKITTGLNAAKDAYEITDAKLVDADEREITIPGVNVTHTNITVTIEVKNTKIKGNFNLKIKKVNEEGQPLSGATFTLAESEGAGIDLTNDSHGTFTSETLDIVSSGEVFIYDIQEVNVPDGYIGIGNKIRVKVITSLNSARTAYVISNAELVNTVGNPTSIPGVTVTHTETDITVEVKNTKIKGDFNLEVKKVDEGSRELPGATFTMEKEGGETVSLTNDSHGTFKTENIDITADNQSFTYEIKETAAPSGYKGITETIRVKVTTGLNSDGDAYEIKGEELVDSEGRSTSIAGVSVSHDGNTVTVTVKNRQIKAFDLALRKYIIEVNGEKIAETKEPSIDENKLNSETTADYKHRKNPVEVNEGDKVKYRISVYNEGEIDGIVTEILDYLPEGLEYDADDNTELTSAYNVTYNSETREIKIAAKSGEEKIFELNAYDKENLDSKHLDIVCTVTASKGTEDKILTNIATMKYEPKNPEDKEIVDRDSSPDRFELPADFENYKGNDENKPELDDKNNFYKGQEDDDDFDKVVIKAKPIEGAFNVTLKKVDENGNLILGANFTMVTEAGETITVTNNEDGTFSAPLTEIKEAGEIFIYEIEEISVPSGYIGLEGKFKIKVATKQSEDGTSYEVEKVELINTEGTPVTIDGITLDVDGNNITVSIKNKKIRVFDLALRKYIVEVNGEKIAETKEPSIDQEKLDTRTTADYKHRKDPIEVNVGDKVKYRISVYNEGDIDGIVTEILDYLPAGLDFSLSDNPEFIEQKESYTESELAGKKYAYTYNSTTGEIRILPINAEYLFKLDAYDKVNLDSEYIDIVCVVTAEEETGDRVLTNIATMKYKPANPEDEEITDRDSNPDDFDLPNTPKEWEDYKGKEENKSDLDDKNNFYEGQEDDDDFDKVVIKGQQIEGEFNVTLKKVDEYGDLVLGAEFSLVTEDRQIVIIKNNGDGTFTGPVTKITEEGETFIYELEEVSVPSGYIGLDGKIKIKVTTKLNEEKTAYVIDKVEFINSTGEPITVDGVTLDVVGNKITVTIVNETIKIFDLALRKFITKVNTEDVTTRIPQVEVKEDGNLKYNHDKTPVLVTNSDIVTYTIRVFNEGNVRGYATEIADDIPDGLEFLPTHETNKKYDWKMYDADGNETENVEAAVEIRTKYLENELLNPYDPSKPISDEEPLNPDYADVEVAFKVVEKDITRRR